MPTNNSTVCSSRYPADSPPSLPGVCGSVGKGREEEQQGAPGGAHRKAELVKARGTAGVRRIEVEQQRGVALEAVLGSQARGEAVLQGSAAGSAVGWWCGMHRAEQLTSCMRCAALESMQWRSVRFSIAGQRTSCARKCWPCS